jgi:hypothetical protein
MDEQLKAELVEQVKTMKWDAGIVILNDDGQELEVTDVSFDNELNRVVIQVQE